MKYLKKKKKNPMLKVLLWLLVVLILAAAALAAWSIWGGAGEDPAGETQNAGTTQNTQPPVSDATEPTVADITISTPYGDFRVSGAWEQYLNVTCAEGESGTMRFTAKVAQLEIPLFDFFFNGVPGEVLGYIRGQDGAQLRVSVVVHEVALPESWSEEEKTVVYAMQSGLNDIIAQMDFEERVEVPVESAVDVELETPYCTLRYPLNWQATLRTEILTEEPYTVRFYAVLEGREDVPLFDMSVAAQGQDPAGHFTAADGSKVYVFLTYHDFTPDETWSEGERNLVYAMMEDANYIFDRLTESNGFEFGA